MPFDLNSPASERLSIDVPLYAAGAGITAGAFGSNLLDAMGIGAVHGVAQTVLTLATENEATGRRTRMIELAGAGMTLAAGEMARCVFGLQASLGCRLVGFLATRCVSWVTFDVMDDLAAALGPMDL